MSFEDVLGHDRQAAVLKRGIITGQMPPAYLFHGEEGIGKRLTALQFAKALNCTGAREPASSCDTCQSCRNVEAGCHPNVTTLALEINADTGKPRQEIVIDQVRRAQEFLSLKAVGEGRKALMVDGAHLMNEGAANAFLKTLEEPPDGSHVIMITSRPSSLLPTIISRCRAMSFQPLNVELTAKLLMDKTGATKEDAYFVARMTGGRAGAALDADAGGLAERRKAAIKLLGFIEDAGYSSLLKKAEDAAKKEGGLEDFLFFGTLWFRDVLVILCGGPVSTTYNMDRAADLQGWASRMTAGRAEAALALLKEAGKAVERTFNRRLLTEDLFFKLREEALDTPATRV